jgi:hypothetical protein
MKSLVTRTLQLNFMPFDQEPIPVTYTAGEADLRQRHEHVARTRERPCRSKRRSVDGKQVGKSLVKRQQNS